jgi:hypothetical protein
MFFVAALVAASRFFISEKISDSFQCSATDREMAFDYYPGSDEWIGPKVLDRFNAWLREKDDLHSPRIIDPSPPEFHTFTARQSAFIGPTFPLSCDRTLSSWVLVAGGEMEGTVYVGKRLVWWEEIRGR